MRIFASNAFITNDGNLPQEVPLYGAWLATDDLYKNIIRYGGFDEYHFFILPDDIKGCRRLLEHFSAYNDKKIKFKKVTELPSSLETTEYRIFFRPSIENVFEISYLRDVYAKRPFPLCGLTHAISYKFLFREMFRSDIMLNLKPFDSLICTSSAGLEAMKRINNSKARLVNIPLGITARDYSRYHKKEARRRLGLPQDKLIILYLGRFSITDKADLHPLIVAFKRLSLKNKNILFLFAGSNSQNNYGRRVKKTSDEMGLSRDTRFFFNPSENNKYLLYAASDIFVSPSDSVQETFGLTVLEAMASGLPVVGSDWDGYKDLIKHNQTGFRIPTYWTRCERETLYLDYLYPRNFQPAHFALAQSTCVDVDKMIEYLSILIRRKDLRLKFGDRAKKRAITEYDWSVIIPKYESLWDELSSMAKGHKASRKRILQTSAHYYKYFRNYPSSMLNKKTKVGITDEGISFLKTRRFPSLAYHPDTIRPRMVLLILFFLNKEGASAIEKIQYHIKGFFKWVGIEKVNYHIIWMLKKYYINIKP